jgi:light-regulated signal transduction histidine kinase (bacteriophytochrome)
VSDGGTALSRAKAQPPDLILSDVMMPVLDGFGLLRAVREDPRTTTIPVVLLSARAGEEAVVEGLETGADDYLVKPFSARELLSRVATHLEMARIRRVATDAARELADTRAALLEDLARKSSELEAFSYSVSHDLRAPLRSIDGFGQVLLEDHSAQLEPKAQDHLRRIRRAAQRMGELIDDLLTLSRIERADLHRERVDLSQLGRYVGDALAKSGPEHHVELRVAPNLTAEVDSRLIQILLENLLGNAWKFTAKAAAARIELGSVDRDGERVFLVRDNGAGFDQTYVDRLFHPFQRLHTETEFPGTGVGLAIVKRIVERHGGRVWAEGSVGAGAALYWTLPAPGVSQAG